MADEDVRRIARDAIDLFVASVFRRGVMVSEPIRPFTAVEQARNEAIAGAVAAATGSPATSETKGTAMYVTVQVRVDEIDEAKAEDVLIHLLEEVRKPGFDGKLSRAMVEGPLDEAWVDWTDGQPSIQMRVYDERVLLHEVMHVAFKRAKPVIQEWIDAAKRNEIGDVFMAEEGIVRALTGALWSMGWRWTRGDGQRDAQAVERDWMRVAAGRDRVIESIRADALADHEAGVHLHPFEECQEGVCPVYWRAVEAARQ